jgi:hypothetical protein
MSRLEIVSPEPDFRRPIFYAWLCARILAICIGKFGSRFLKFETFKMQQLDDVPLLQLHRNDPLQLFTVFIAEIPAIFSRAKPKLLQHPSIPRAY